MRILVVDDDALCRAILSDMLKDIGKCDLAPDGYEAIDAFMHARTEGAPYDLICLDVIMPGMDGLQVLKQIRSIEARDSIAFPDSVRVIVVSSMSDLEYIMMSFDPRCEIFMIKPFDREQLLNNLALLGLAE